MADTENTETETHTFRFEVGDRVSSPPSAYGLRTGTVIDRAEGTEESDGWDWYSIRYTSGLVDHFAEYRLLEV
jgi:hypothetical protein